MPRYARCNNFTSLALNKNGEPCRFMSVKETDQEIVDEMVAHITNVHNIDGRQLVANIKYSIYSTGKKTFSTRAPDQAEEWHGHPV